MSDEVLVVGKLERHFEERAVLRGLDLRMRAGERLVIMGPSGSGKSTLLQCIAGIDSWQAGTVLVAGRDVGAMDADARCALRAQTLGLVFQDHHLLPQATVLENVLMPCLALADRADAAQQERARALLTAVGLGDRCEAWPRQLSGGERQRVAVARALVMRPALILADEPTGALDAALAAEVTRLLIELAAADDAALLCVSHDAQLAEAIGSCRVLRDGVLGAA